MRKRLVVLACAVLLSGCESYGDLTSDAFDPGTVTQSRFTMDAAHCEAQADIPRNYEVIGIAGTRSERHEIFNEAFTACMRLRGYARRDWSPDIPVPYNIDPTPG